MSSAIKKLHPLLSLIVILCAAMLLSPQAKAQGIHITSKIDTNILIIGDQVKFTLKAEHSSDYKVTFPVVPDSMNHLEVVSRSPIDTTVAQGLITEKQSFFITAFDSGAYVLPPFNFTFTKGNDTTRQEMLSDAQALMVRSLDVDTTRDIRDIKAPLSPPFDWKELIPYAAGALVLAAIIFGIIWYLRRRKKPVQEAPRNPRRPAHETALDALDKLQADKMWQAGQLKQYHSRLTDIIRIYIEERFSIFAMEKTTDEIMDSFAALQLAPEVLQKLRLMLELADFVKFAKVHPLPEENQRSMETAYFFVRETMNAMLNEPDGNDKDKEVAP